MTSTQSDTLAADDRLEASVEHSAFIERLPAEVRDRVLECMHPVTFEAGEVVLREGMPTPFLGILTRGRVGLRLQVPGRGPTTVLTIEPGQLLGWSACVPPYRSTATAVALVPAEIAVIEAEALQKAIAEDPACAAAILPRVLEAVAARLGESWSQLLDLFASAPMEPW